MIYINIRNGKASDFPGPWLLISIKNGKQTLHTPRLCKQEEEWTAQWAELNCETVREGKVSPENPNFRVHGLIPNTFSGFWLLFILIIKMADVFDLELNDPETYNADTTNGDSPVPNFFHENQVRTLFIEAILPS